MDEKETTQPAKKALYKRWWVWVLGVIVLFIVIGSLGGNDKGATTANTSKPAEATKTTQTLLKLSGSGTKSTEKFTVGGDWTLDWTYDCAKFGQAGNFIVTPTGEDNVPSFANTMVNQLGTSGNGIENYHKSGTYYLNINSVCSWTVEVKG